MNPQIIHVQVTWNAPAFIMFDCKPESKTQPEWRNWQTRRIQNPLTFWSCGFESHLRYQPFDDEPSLLRALIATSRHCYEPSSSVPSTSVPSTSVPSTSVPSTSVPSTSVASSSVDRFATRSIRHETKFLLNAFRIGWRKTPSQMDSKIS